MNDSLDALTERAKLEIEMTAHPRADWMPVTHGPDGDAALDVLVIGGGQGGATVGFGLKRARVDRVLIVDAAPRGREGP